MEPTPLQTSDTQPQEPLLSAPTPSEPIIGATPSEVPEQPAPATLPTPIASALTTTPARTGTHLWGFVILACTFGASATLTALYLSNAAQQPQTVLVAAAATATTTAPAPSPFDAITLAAKSAIVTDMATGRVLYEKDADLQWPLASLTKLPLVLAVAEVLAPNDIIVIPYDTKPFGSPQRMAYGTRWHAQDVIDLTLAASSNEGADILAAAADAALAERYPQAPQGSAAVWRMNALTRSINLPHTYFLNPTGLDESSTQSGAYGTARDMAALFTYAATTMPERFDATARPSVSITSIEGDVATAINTDEALDAIPGLILGKTGYTDLAGGNLGVVFRTTDGRTMTAIVLGSTQQGRFSDMRTLVQAAENMASPRPLQQDAARVQ